MPYVLYIGGAALLGLVGWKLADEVGELGKVAIIGGLVFIGGKLVKAW